MNRMFALVLFAACSASCGPAAPTIDGKVLAVRPDIHVIMISIGSEDGVEPGDNYRIYRDGRFIAEVKVEKVFRDMSSARLLDRSVPMTIQERDGASKARPDDDPPQDAGK